MFYSCLYGFIYTRFCMVNHQLIYWTSVKLCTISSFMGEIHCFSTYCTETPKNKVMSPVNKTKSKMYVVNIDNEGPENALIPVL